MVKREGRSQAVEMESYEPGQGLHEDILANGTSPQTSNLESSLGNHVVHRFLAQRDSGGVYELDDETERRIEAARGGGQALDSQAAEEMGGAIGADFEGVRVHSSQESDELNQQLNARAFTTGSDIFFRQGEYKPRSASGKQLLAHELTHVVQQSQGRVGGGDGRMTVNEPGDAFEHEAEAVAKSVAQGTGADLGAEASAQRQPVEEEEELQMQPVEEEEELQLQEMEEEEEELQLKIEKGGRKAVP